MSYEPNDPDEVAQLRIPPHSNEAESSVLGALLLDPGTGGYSAYDRVADILVADDFYRFEHRLIFDAVAMLDAANKPTDVVAVHDRLQGMKGGGEVGLGYLNQLAQYVPTAKNVRRYGEIVRGKSMLRKLIGAADQIATSGFAPGLAPVEDVVDAAEALIMGISDQRKDDDWQDTEQAVVGFLDWATDMAQGGHEKQDFIPTGLRDLDENLDGGLRPGDVVVIGARPRMGKTALALGILEHIALNEGLPVALMSMEMPKEQVTMRRVSAISRIPMHKLRRPERMDDVVDWPALTEAIEKLRHSNFHVSDKGALSLNQIRARARMLKRTKGLRVLGIDYLGLMETDAKENRAAALGRISRGLKALAKELGIAILLLSQMNRAIESRQNRRPMLSDLRESGDIEQDADIILFPYREIEDNPKLPDAFKWYGEIILAKQRNGAANIDIPVGWHGPTARYHNWEGAKPNKDGSIDPAPTKHTGPVKTKKVEDNPL